MQYEVEWVSRAELGVLEKIKISKKIKIKLPTSRKKKERQQNAKNNAVL
jgi:hypothetical protein